MIRQTLRDLPIGLAKTYERILLKISNSPSPKQEIALRVFRWTVCCRRPMKLEELQEAVAFESSDSFWDKDKIPDGNLMIETCRGLLIRDEDDMTVRFAHHTVQQYLLSGPVISIPEGSRFLVSNLSESKAFVGQVCVTYLSFHDFETQITLRPSEVNSEPLGVLISGGLFSIPAVLGIGRALLEIPYRLLRGKATAKTLDIDCGKYLTPTKRNRPQAPPNLTEKFRFLEYVVEYWMDHTQDIEFPYFAELRQLAMHKTASFEFRPWGSNQHFGPYGCVSCTDATKAKDLRFMSLFHYAAQVGHWTLMDNLVAEYCQHELPFNETLLIACRHGQDQIVRNLMRKVKCDISDGRAVKFAAAAGHTGVLESLLNFGLEAANDGSRCSSYNIIPNSSSLLNLAATNGHEKVIDVVFKYCHKHSEKFSSVSCVNEKDKRSNRTALFSAVLSGHENIVRNLLKRGALISAHGNTALHIAAEHGHDSILQILLESAAEERNGDSDSKSHHSDNEGGIKESLPQMLLNSYDPGGETPLHKAAKIGHSAAVELMLKHQPRLELRTLEHRILNPGVVTALLMAAQRGHLEVVNLLLEHGASVEAESCGNDWTALHIAAAEGHKAVVLYLLENATDPDAGANHGIKALQLAVGGGHDGVVRALLSCDFKKLGLNADNIEMASLIERAAKDSQEAVLRAFLDWLAGSERGLLEEILQVAEQKSFHRALDVLNPLEEQQMRKRDLELVALSPKPGMDIGT